LGERKEMWKVGMVWGMIEDIPQTVETVSKYCKDEPVE
jgi:hypothetical protein